jgi:hypothetical protein
MPKNLDSIASALASGRATVADKKPAKRRTKSAAKKPAKRKAAKRPAKRKAAKKPAKRTVRQLAGGCRTIPGPVATGRAAHTLACGRWTR